MAPGAVASPAASPAAAVPGTDASSASSAVPKVAGFPKGPIEIIVPLPPGGGFDAVARQLAVPMSEILGQPVVVKNVPGGGGRLGAREFQQKPADGQTLGYMVDQGLYVTQLLGQAEGFDMNGWQWVAGIRQSPQAVMVGRDSPFKSIHDALAADKAGQRLRMGHNGLGNGFLISDLIFVKALGIQNYVLVGGFNGTADMVPALARGDLDVNVLGPIASNIQFVQSGDVRPLMVVTKERNALIPDVKTPAEENAPGAAELNEAGSSTGFVVVGGTPPEIVKVLEAATLKAVKDPKFVEWAVTTGVAPDLIALTGAETSARKEREYAIYRKYLDDIAKYQ